LAAPLLNSIENIDPATNFLIVICASLCDLI
jgi:hypothetical protein